MISLAKNYNEKNLDKMKNNINKWFISEEKFLNIISPPYNKIFIFDEIIYKCIKNGGKVLYITNEKESISFIEYIKNTTRFRDYTYIKSPNSIYQKSSLVIVNFDKLSYIDLKFELIVYNDLEEMPVLGINADEIKNKISRLCKFNGKIVFCSIESMAKGYNEIVLPIRQNKKPICEPRFIITRLNINKEIPYVMYSYLKWTMEIGRKSIIYVPKGDNIIRINEYLYLLEGLKGKVDYYIENSSDWKTLDNFSKKKQGILITDYLKEQNLSFANTNIMVWIANDKKFDYKTLFYLMSRIGLNGDFERGETIFLANEETKNMEKSKRMARKFNEISWELGLINMQNM